MVNRWTENQMAWSEGWQSSRCSLSHKPGLLSQTKTQAHRLWSYDLMQV